MAQLSAPYSYTDNDEDKSYGRRRRNYGARGGYGGDDDDNDDAYYYGDSKEKFDVVDVDPETQFGSKTPATTEEFVDSILQAHGMIGCENPEEHPSSKEILPIEADETMQRPAQETKATVETIANKFARSAQSETEGKREDPDYTLLFDEWVRQGEERGPVTEKRPHPDECDPVPMAKMQSDLKAAIHSGKPYKGSTVMVVHSKKPNKNDKQIYSQKTHVGLAGEFANGRYSITAELTPVDSASGELHHCSKARARLVEVAKKTPTATHLTARRIESGVVALKNQCVPDAVIDATSQLFAETFK